MRNRHSYHRWQVLLVDRDGLLIKNHPYLADPEKVVVLDGVAEALSLARERGFRIAVISNQSGIARDLISWRELYCVNQLVEELLGPFEGWFLCTHLPNAGCACRKPAPGLIVRAAEALRVPVGDCFMAGDRLSDVEAAFRAGTRGGLVPTPDTPVEEIALSPKVFPTLTQLVESLIAEGGGSTCA